MTIAKAEHSSEDAIRNGAKELIAAGNTLESVAGVLGVSIETLRGWAAEPAAMTPEDGGRAPAAEQQPWFHFPGTVVYPTGSNWAIIAVALIATVIIIPASGWQLAFRPHPRPVLIATSLLVGVAMVAAAIQSIRAARVNCFEMRPEAIARYNLAGCTVLPYKDIVGLSAVLGKGFYYVQFLTRTGVLMTIHPSFSQLDEDERLWSWLQAVPKPDGSSISRPSDF